MAMKTPVSSGAAANLQFQIAGSETPQSQVTAVSLETRLQGVEVAARPKTETAESIARACGYNVGSVRNVIARLGFSQNGVKTALTAEQAEAVKKRLLAGIARAGNAGDTTFISDMKVDPALELASLYARIDEIKSARITALEAETAEWVSRKTPEGHFQTWKL
ncbi:MAG: hypothetical protein LBH85_01205 [Treponema sp.]|jgi:hypothetical protein|nr:hypothetical protein [Treponema sp.]